MKSMTGPGGGSLGLPFTENGERNEFFIDDVFPVCGLFLFKTSTRFVSKVTIFKQAQRVQQGNVIFITSCLLPQRLRLLIGLRVSFQKTLLCIFACGEHEPSLPPMHGNTLFTRLRNVVLFT